MNYYLRRRGFTLDQYAEHLGVSPIIIEEVAHGRSRPIQKVLRDMNADIRTKEFVVWDFKRVLPAPYDEEEHF